MLLCEFEDSSTDAAILGGVVSQILNRIKDTGYTKKYSLKSLQNQLAARGIDLDSEKFREAAKNPPLSNLISNVEGNTIIFHDENASSSQNTEVDDTTSTLKKMAKKAEKKRKRP